MLKEKNLLYYTNLVSSNRYEKNNKIILEYFNNTKLKNYFSNRF